jgi:selenocysteine lyase/cysteine desulfurase
VLTTDLEWPGYLEILRQESERARGQVFEVKVGAEVFRGELSAGDVCQRIGAEYRKQNADGLFLSVVNCQGVRLPVTEILQDAETSRRPPAFTVLDDAQGIGHVTHDFGLSHCDLLLACCHKWLRAHVPLSAAVCIRPRSHEYIRLALEAMTKSWEADDPLLSFFTRLENGCPESFSETVNVLGVFTARAALADACHHGLANAFDTLVTNSQTLIKAAADTPWKALTPHSSLRSGITLFQTRRRDIKEMRPKFLRDLFLGKDVALSAYDQGVIRVSAPNSELSAKQAHGFSLALAS